MTKYTLDPVAFRENLLNAPFMVEEMKRRAEAIKALAEATAPVDEEGPHPGRYRDSFSIESGRDGGIHSDRAYAIVRNDAVTDGKKPISLAVVVEFGTEHSPAHHTLGRAMDAGR